MYLYIIATKHYLNSIGEDAQLYKIIPYIVVVQTKDNFETAVYSPDIDSVKIAKGEVETLLDEMKWHFENNLWDFPRAYYEGDGSLIVGLKKE